MYISFIRTVILYGIVLLAVRIMGKRQIGQLQSNELVIMMLISDLIVIPMQDTGQPLFSGLIPVFVLITLEIALSFCMLKSRKFRRLLCGKPVVVIQKGKLLQKQLKALRMSTDELLEQLRQKEISAFTDVESAIMEPNGSLSVQKKAEADVVRPKDLQLSVRSSGMELAVISDGVLEKTVLPLLHKNADQVLKILKKEKTDLADVFLLLMDESGKYVLIRKEHDK